MIIWYRVVYMCCRGDVGWFTCGVEVMQGVIEESGEDYVVYGGLYVEQRWCRVVYMWCRGDVGVIEESGEDYVVQGSLYVVQRCGVRWFTCGVEVMQGLIEESGEDYVVQGSFYVVQRCGVDDDWREWWG